MRINSIKLVTAMMRLDLTQKQLAERAGVSRATINGIKCGRSCSDRIGIKIAEALQVPIEKLLEK
ncbi:MAG: helix-turn-helix transcriptional regulator [Lachnospiraceae bacterium]|nr:helix-turn-helix transcriptional regulator [Lachnospiraceae bacterium]